MVLLEEYDAVLIRETPSSYKFFIPMDSASDIILADLATELNAFNGRMVYEHERYYSVDGVQKHRDPYNGRWSAVVTARKV